MAILAIKGMNGQKFKGRPLTVELSVQKLQYEKRIDALVEHTNMDRKEAIRPMSLKWEERAEKAKKAEDEAV